MRALRVRFAGPAAALTVLAAVPALTVTVAFAQPTVPGDAPTTGTSSSTTTTTTTTPTLNPYAPPPGANQDKGPIGGGNATESSARTRVGEERDGFDLGSAGTGGTATVHGNKNGPIWSTRGHAGEVPYQHVVRRGDTLSGICDFYYRNPYQWPRVWSFNPQIQNPHWIYPGDMIRLRQGGAASPARPTSSTGYLDRGRQLPHGAALLRDEGFIEDGSGEDWGELTGSPSDKMFLTERDQAYVHIAGSRDVRVGQELTIFRPLRSAPPGQIIQIQGTLRVEQWNGAERVAKGTLTESLDVVERGARVGPIGRRFQLSAPVRNESDVQAMVITSLHPNNFYGQNQLVFIDKGKKDGLKVGNRLFIMRKGDAWRRSLVAHGPAELRISPESENLPDVERVPGTRDEGRYPDEMVGELRVVHLQDKSATCLVTQSRLEIERGDVAVSRKGY